MGPKLSFLLGGDWDLGKIRVELLVNGQVVRKALADDCRENMRRREWDVRQFKNQFGRLRFVDALGKGHVNFDDLWADFSCSGECFVHKAKLWNSISPKQNSIDASNRLGEKKNKQTNKSVPTDTAIRLS